MVAGFGHRRLVRFHGLAGGTKFVAVGAWRGAICAGEFDDTLWAGPGVSDSVLRRRVRHAAHKVDAGRRPDDFRAWLVVYDTVAPAPPHAVEGRKQNRAWHSANDTNSADRTQGRGSETRLEKGVKDCVRSKFNLAVAGVLLTFYPDFAPDARIVRPDRRGHRLEPRARFRISTLWNKSD